MNEEIFEAKISPLKSISIVWLVPVVAILIGIWIIFSHISSLGPVISIQFQSGQGIEATKTKIRFKNVDIGIVEKIELNQNGDGVSVTARIDKHNAYLLKQDTQFWVVKPRIGKSGVSGISTLFSGAYIELSAGVSKQVKYSFKGLETIPVTLAGTPGIHVTLDSSGYRALQIGDPILFRGIAVGRIEYVYFNAEERRVYYNAFIESPYDALITTNTKFWEVNGFEMDLSANGVRIQTGTIESLISGGVTFDVPENTPRGEVITQREFFTIHPNEESIYENKYQQAINFILLFKDSIRGLKPDAPVEYKGIKIGSVVRTDVNYSEISNILNPKLLIPVLVKIEPARLGFGFGDNKEALVAAEKSIVEFMKKGLRGRLSTGNLLTGSQFIDLQYDEPVTSELAYFSGYIVIPTIEGQFDQILTKVGKLIDKLQKLPLESVIGNADQALLKMSDTLSEFQGLAKSITVLSKQITDQNIVASIESTLLSFKTLASSFSEGSLTHQQLQEMLITMKKALSKLEPLLIELNQKPNSLIFSQPKNADMEPKGE